MNRGNKTIALLLALVLWVQCFGVAALAAETEATTDGSENHAAFPDEGSEQVEYTQPEDVLPDQMEEPTDDPETPSEPVPEAEAPAADPVTEPMQGPLESEPNTSPVKPWFPQFFQDDYPNIMFGGGTVKSSGCSITCLAMVATYLTGHTYTPDVLAEYFGGKANNNIERMEYGIRKLQLPCEKNWNWHVTYDAIKNGKVVIMLVGKRSPFTDSQHFLVVNGMTEDGRIWVYDSIRSNYERWDLAPGFERGFSPDDVCAGFSGAWVFDPDAMPENPFIYEGEVLCYTECRYNDLQLTAQELELMAKIVWLEAQGESFEGQQAVAEVILNRMIAVNFQSSIHGVIYAEDQFRSLKYLSKAEPTQTQYEAVERALYGPYVLPIDVVYFAQTPSNENVWGTIGGHVFCYQWWVTDGEKQE